MGDGTLKYRYCAQATQMIVGGLIHSLKCIAVSVAPGGFWRGTAKQRQIEDNPILPLVPNYPKIRDGNYIVSRINETSVPSTCT